MAQSNTSLRAQRSNPFLKGLLRSFLTRNDDFYAAQFILFVFLLFSSCNPPSPQSEQKALSDKLDSLHSEISELKLLLEEKKKTTDTLSQQRETDSVSVVKTEQKTPTEKPQIKETPTKVSKPSKPANDTTYHYYTNGKISVKITPWHESKRKLFFYDLKGAQTFELEDVRHSYSITTQLKFHSNGAASVAEIHSNPGASRYWYETEITFDTTNEPLVKYDRQMPQERIDLEENLPSFWNKQKQQWVKQEIVKETSTPDGK